MNDSEATMEIQTAKDIDETEEEMKSPQDFPQRVPLGNNNDANEEHQPFHDVPDIMAKEEEEQFEMVPMDQIEYMTGPQIIHEYRNFLCCYYYKQIRRIKKKEDIESGKPNKITRVIEAKEWLLGMEPVSDELYVWALKASSWSFIAVSLIIICTKLLTGLYLLLTGSDIWWTDFLNAAMMVPILGGCYLWQRRIVRKALEKNDMSEARKQYKVMFLVLPYLLGLLLPTYTLSFMGLCVK